MTIVEVDCTAWWTAYAELPSPYAFLTPGIPGAVFCHRCNDVTDWQAGTAMPCETCSEDGVLRLAQQTFPC